MEKDCVSHGVPLEERGTEDTGRGSPEHGWDLRDFSQGGKEPCGMQPPCQALVTPGYGAFTLPARPPQVREGNSL